MSNLFTCVVFFDSLKVAKLRNVNTKGLQRLETLPGVVYFNVYNKINKVFIKRIYVNDAFLVSGFDNLGILIEKRSGVINLDKCMIHFKSINNGVIKYCNIYNLRTKQFFKTEIFN